MIKNSFYPNSLEENTKTLTSYLPEGKLYDAKNIKDSNFNKLMRALAHEFGRNQYTLYELEQEYDLNKTNNLINEWEAALGIPDDCFSTDVDIATRRIQCIAKLAKMNISTYNDWIVLANFLGYNISIEYGIKYMVFPLTLPFILGSEKTAKFTIIINFLDLPKPSSIFPLTLPFTLGDSGNVLRCIFGHLKPANVQILYKYLG